MMSVEYTISWLTLATKFLLDEQINPKVAEALRDKDIEAVSVHDIGLANQGFQDEALLTLAVEREETLITLDNDFLRIHAKWMAENKTHYGIFYASTDKYQRTGAIGVIVKFCAEMDSLIEQGAGTLEIDIYNQLIFITEA